MHQSAPSSAGVYLIANGATGKVYVGSARDIRARLLSHRRGLRAGTHHCALLQRASVSTIYETRRGRYWKHIGAQETVQ